MSPTPPLGFVVGLAIEARLLAAQASGARLKVACAAASAEGARRAARRLLSDGAGGLVSFGIAGALDPDLAPGDIVLPERIVAPEARTLPTDAALRDAWARAVRAAGLRAVGGTLSASAEVVTAAADKQARRRATGAAALDMESYAVAEIAADAGVPFVAVRAIADPAERSLPRAVIGSIAPDGRARVGRVLLGLGLRPWDLPALLQLRKDTAAALASLSRLVGHWGAAGLG